MCGIAGFAGFPIVEKRDREILERMVARLAHRGPDETGVLLGRRAAVGMRRLSIIDLAGGRQPIVNEAGNLAIVFNGEIYNHAELRQSLEKGGHRFKTQSDTEVILHAYEQFKTQALDWLHGMFAFAVVDSETGAAFLARDRFGEKPLYYFEHEGGIVFASEVRSLGEHPACPRKLDLESVGLFLRHEFVPSPRTLIEGIRQLEPGTSLLLRDGRLHSSAYWSIRVDEGQARPEVEPGELESLITEAVRSRMVSDVPVGAFLSGGLDSSLVAWRMSLLQEARIKAFCIGFEEESFDESAEARTAAEALGVDLEVETLTETAAADALPKILEAMDLPIADASFVPVYFLSRLAARWGKVVLSGDGGDEAFAGYPTYRAHWWADHVPQSAMRLAGRVARALPVEPVNFSLRFKLERFASGAGLAWPERHVEWMGSFSASEAGQMLRRDQALSSDPVLDWMRALPAANTYNNPPCADQRFYLGENLLAKVDRASMAHSLEVRAPFLDHRLVERVGAAPWSSKFNPWQGKLPLRRLAEKIFPASIARKPKKGFGIPLARWLQGKMRPFAEEIFSEHSLRGFGFLDPEIPRRLWHEHLEGKADHRKPLWTLIALLSWARRKL